MSLWLTVSSQHIEEDDTVNKHADKERERKQILHLTSVKSQLHFKRDLRSTEMRLCYERKIEVKESVTWRKNWDERKCCVMKRLKWKKVLC